MRVKCSVPQSNELALQPRQPIGVTQSTTLLAMGFSH